MTSKPPRVKAILCSRSGTTWIHRQTIRMVISVTVKKQMQFFATATRGGKSRCRVRWIRDFRISLWGDCQQKFCCPNAIGSKKRTEERSHEDRQSFLCVVDDCRWKIEEYRNGTQPGKPGLDFLSVEQGVL